MNENDIKDILEEIEIHNRKIAEFLVKNYEALEKGNKTHSDGLRDLKESIEKKLQIDFPEKFTTEVSNPVQIPDKQKVEVDNWPDLPKSIKLEKPEWWKDPEKVIVPDKVIVSNFPKQNEFPKQFQIKETNNDKLKGEYYKYLLQLKEKLKSKPINASRNEINEIVSASAGKSIKVYSVKFNIGAKETSVKWLDGDKSLEGAMLYSIREGHTESVTPPMYLFKTSIGNSLNLAVSPQSVIRGRVSYWEE